ncbi:MAG: Mut7-C RNAse domain-containing protein [Methanobacteriota archaeon]|nr:MAG: Mut7-C RNAse domain-containing protein [Euryarchaeota archaeon]
MRFICDHMLGALARWMRLLGFDVLYPGPISDREIIGIAVEEDRVILTRDKELSSTDKAQALYVESDDLEEQLLATMSELELKVTDPMSRCSLCNAQIEKVDKTSVEGEVPEGVFDRQEEFWYCPTCNKYYWQGSHWDRITKTIEKLVGS